MTFKLGMLHQILKYFKDCSNDDFGLTLTYLGQSQIWKNDTSQDIMEKILAQKWSLELS